MTVLKSKRQLRRRGSRLNRIAGKCCCLRLLTLILTVRDDLGLAVIWPEEFRNDEIFAVGDATGPRPFRRPSLPLC